MGWIDKRPIIGHHVLSITIPHQIHHAVDTPSQDINPETLHIEISRSLVKSGCFGCLCCIPRKESPLLLSNRSKNTLKIHRSRHGG
jgi:hypothetical protein